ncbi:MAG: hypothetical protein JO110_14630 [Acetobacteraceae bacterium]|nr:hypothetical protein [Acetobacteraceae bacterium]
MIFTDNDLQLLLRCLSDGIDQKSGMLRWLKQTVKEKRFSGSEREPWETLAGQIERDRAAMEALIVRIVDWQAQEERNRHE